MNIESSDAPNADMHAVITKMIRDMKIIGLFYLVSGALSCLSIIGAIIGIPYIFAGLRLRESASEYLGWLDHEEGALFRALAKQQQHFFILMVMMVIMLIFSVLMTALVFMLLAAGILSEI